MMNGREPLQLIHPDPAGWDKPAPPWRRRSCWLCLALLVASISLAGFGLFMLWRMIF
jgi:hypothetical protein